MDCQRNKVVVSEEERRITLAYAGVSQPPPDLHVYSLMVETLDLSHNRIGSVDFLAHFPNLSTLILDHNLCDENTQFPPMPKLRTLWMNHNQMGSLLPFIPNLRRVAECLQCLSLMGNEGAPSYLNGGTYHQYLQYRLYVISWFPHLRYLDDCRVKEHQMREATRLYHAREDVEVEVPSSRIVKSLKKQQVSVMDLFKKLRTMVMEKEPFHEDESALGSPTSISSTFFRNGTPLTECHCEGMVRSASSSSTCSIFSDTVVSPHPSNEEEEERGALMSYIKRSFTPIPMPMPQQQRSNLNFVI